MTKIPSLLLILSMLSPSCSESTLVIPETALFQICQLLRKELDLPRGVLIVIDQSKPAHYEVTALYLAMQIESLSSATLSRLTEVEHHLNGTSQSLEVRVPREASCELRISKSSRDVVAGNTYRLQLSGILDPQDAGRWLDGQGLFIRFSLDSQQGARWFWVPLGDASTTWNVDRLLPLDIEDG